MLDLKESERLLAALGEASRLRLLSLCALAERAVGDLAGALGQSEPRVSRHLRILAEAGLVERRRDGHSVRYRAVTTGDAGDIMRTVLARLDSGDAILRRDIARIARRAPGVPVIPLPCESRLGRAMCEFVDGGAGGTLPAAGPVLLLGVRHLELIEAATRLGHPATVIAGSAASADVARAWADAHLPRAACEVLTSVPAAAASWSAVLVDRAGDPLVASAAASGRRAAGGRLPPLAPALLEARTLLAPRGTLWLFERYDSLEEAGDGDGRHPLGRLRALLEASGFGSERIRPLETDGVHVLATRAIRTTMRHETLPGSSRSLPADQREATS